MAQYIYTMNRVSKVVPPKRTILRDISLSFFPGAKIGVLGLNGSGKSSLLRIMAGTDASFDGEARPQSGIRVGFLPQEPELDDAKDVRTTVMEGVGATFSLLEQFNQISDKFAEPMSDDEMTALLEKQAKLQDAIDAAGGWELERKLEIAGWRCAGCSCPHRTCCCSTSRPTTSTRSPSRGSSATSRSIRVR
jgi:sulfate-transporting ATPase